MDSTYLVKIFVSSINGLLPLFGRGIGTDHHDTDTIPLKQGWNEFFYIPRDNTFDNAGSETENHMFPQIRAAKITDGAGRSPEDVWEHWNSTKTSENKFGQNFYQSDMNTQWPTNAEMVSFKISSVSVKLVESAQEELCGEGTEYPDEFITLRVQDRHGFGNTRKIPIRIYDRDFTFKIKLDI